MGSRVETRRFKLWVCWSHWIQPVQPHPGSPTSGSLRESARSGCGRFSSASSSFFASSIEILLCAAAASASSSASFAASVASSSPPPSPSPSEEESTAGVDLVSWDPPASSYATAAEGLNTSLRANARTMHVTAKVVWIYIFWMEKRQEDGWECTR
jgi:hypothetical protein